MIDIEPSLRLLILFTFYGQLFLSIDARSGALSIDDFLLKSV